jgi:predicted dehydrogenase
MQFGTLSISGHFLNRILPALRNSKTVTMHGIASRDPEKAKEHARIHKIPKAYTSYDELIHDGDIEAVYIPLPNNLHAEWIKKCADHGKHILCEKPLAMDAAEASEAVSYAEEKGVYVMEAFMYRFHPQWERAEAIIHSGEIGTLRSIHTYFGYNNRNAKDIRNIKSTGGGALYDIGCYAISSARFLIGREPSRALCLIETDPSFETDILTSGVLDFGNIRSLFTVGTQIFNGQRVEAYGTDGILTIELPFNARPDIAETIIVRNGTGERTEKLGPADQYRIQFERFAESVREGKSVPTPPSDAIANMKAIDALFKSSETGGWIDLEQFVK